MNTNTRKEILSRFTSLQHDLQLSEARLRHVAARAEQVERIITKQQVPGEKNSPALTKKWGRETQHESKDRI